MANGLTHSKCKGHSGALTVVIQSYAPGIVLCGSPGPRSPAAETCGLILESMPVDTAFVVFGQQGQQDVQVVVPKVFSSREYGHVENDQFK